MVEVFKLATESIKLATTSYISNWKLVSFFSIPFLLAVLIPLLVQMPVYVTSGGIFLRTGSLYTDLGMFDVGVIVASFLLSLFLVSFGIVAINLVIKSQRTFTNIRTEVYQSIEKYVLNVFWLYLTTAMVLLIFNLISYEFGINQWLTPIMGMLISLPIIFAPTAMVIDDQGPYAAMRSSLSVVKRHPSLFLMWILLGMLLISFIDLIFLAIGSSVPGFSPFARYFVLVLNSLLILPYLVMLQVQIYLTKYTILQ